MHVRPHDVVLTGRALVDERGLIDGLEVGGTLAGGAISNFPICGDGCIGIGDALLSLFRLLAEESLGISNF